jgi:methionyl-tRNA formyltransferase
MRILFIGTADIGTTSLEWLGSARQHQLVGVVTQPDRPAGRLQTLTPPPIKTLALRLGVLVLQPEKVRVPELAPELIVVIAYGQILRKELLEIPKFGCVNLHASLLPRWRGASPIQAALLAGDTETGVTAMLMDEGVDTGPMLLQERLTITPEDNAGTLHDKLGQLGAAVLMKTLDGISIGTLRPTPQPPEGATYAGKITKEDGLIDWKLSAQQLLNRLRAFTPWPGLFTYLSDERRCRMLKIWSASVEAGAGEAGVIVRADEHGIAVGTGAGLLVVHELQFDGSRRMSTADFLRGHSLKSGTKLG